MQRTLATAHRGVSLKRAGAANMQHATCSAANLPGLSCGLSYSSSEAVLTPSVVLMMIVVVCSSITEQRVPTLPCAHGSFFKKKCELMKQLLLKIPSPLNRKDFHFHLFNVYSCAIYKNLFCDASISLTVITLKCASLPFTWAI